VSKSLCTCNFSYEKFSYNVDFSSRPALRSGCSAYAEFQNNIFTLSDLITPQSLLNKSKTSIARQKKLKRQGSVRGVRDRVFNFF